jgi:hypothetical protein
VPNNRTEATCRRQADRDKESPIADNSYLARDAARAHEDEALRVTSLWLLAAMAIVVAEIGIMFLIAYLISR